MYVDEISMIVFEVIKLRSIYKNDRSFRTMIEQNLPEGPHVLMYKNRCIQNVHNEEYLYASQPAGDDRRFIFTEFE